MTVQLARRLFNVDDYHRMAKAGILNEDDRVELIEGEIVQMTPIESRHASVVSRLTALLTRSIPETEALTWVQNPIRLTQVSEPQPDVALLKPKNDFYAERLPHADEVLLLIAVADSSVELDQEIKVPLYARAGILEVWVVDLQAETVHVYSRPAAGAYTTHQAVSRSGELVASGLSRLTLKASDILA